MILMHPLGKMLRSEDVLLVQYLISIWMAHEKDIPKLLPIIQSTPELKIDGICGEKTKANIRAFETFHQPLVNLDGRIDPAFQTNKTNKMFLLNEIFFLAGGLRGGSPEFINAKLRIPFPRELIKPLYR